MTFLACSVSSYRPIFLHNDHVVCHINIFVRKFKINCYLNNSPNYSHAPPKKKKKKIVMDKLQEVVIRQTVGQIEPADGALRQAKLSTNFLCYLLLFIFDSPIL